jgi:LPXTG-site transpeptidase (sortase) family protein
MQSKILSIKILLLIIFLAGVFFLALFFYFIASGFIKSGLAPLVKNVSFSPLPDINYALPARLQIPKINVDAPVDSVGVTKTGAMDVPQGGTSVAWFKYGPRPGNSGSAVIAGHYGTWQNGQGSVFDNLNKLGVGDKLYIKDEKGTKITFVVRQLGTYGLNGNPSDVFNSNDGKEHLNLITCEGVWDNVSKTYSQRLVVFADKL